MTIPERCRGAGEAELVQLYNATGIDLSGLPVIATPAELAPTIRKSEGALAQDRFRHQGIPFIKMGKSIRYARSEVARYLMANHQTTVG